MKQLIYTIIFLFVCSSFVKAQEAKLNTTPKSYKPKVKVIYDTQTTNVSHHGPAIWIFNNKVEIKTYRPIINLNNVDEIYIDDKNRSIRVKYKIEKPEIVGLYELSKKHCMLSQKDILFSIDDEWQKQPDSVFVAIDAIKHVRVVDSNNYPYLSNKKNSFVVVDIKTVNPPKKEEDNDGKPKIYIR